MDPSTLLTIASSTHSFPIWPTSTSTSTSKPPSLSTAFTFTSTNTTDPSSHALVRTVTTPWLLGFPPTNQNPNQTNHHRAILLLSGGGYTELHIGREGIQVASWLCALGFTCFVLVHRFPNSSYGAQAPLDDARQALRAIKEKGYGGAGSRIGVCGLSSGGHLAASLIAGYPEEWKEKGSGEVPRVEFMVVGYAPISTNAVGRQIVPNKAPLDPKEKQELYDTVQPDAQMIEKPPPTFIVYAGNDAVVPVVNAYRLATALGEKGASVEVHVFADAPHGFGIDTVGKPVSGWMGMCEAWMKQLGILG